MRVQLDSTRTIHVRIQHTVFSCKKEYDGSRAIPDVEDIQKPKDAKGKTMAEVTLLSLGASPSLPYVGACFCAVGDNFTRSAGLKTSLARAFKKAGTQISKEDRAIVWNAVLGGKYKRAQQAEVSTK